MSAEARQGAEAGPSNAGPAVGVEARFGLPNQASTVAIQTCLQTGPCQTSCGKNNPHIQHSNAHLTSMTVSLACPLLRSACRLKCSTAK